MDLLYVSPLCSERRFSQLMRDLPVKPVQQVQKFHSLLTRGLSSLRQTVTALSLLPRQPGTWGIPRTSSETEHGITHRHLSLRMLPGLSHAIVFLWSLGTSLRWCLARRNRPRAVVCDVLALSISAGALLASKLTGTPAVAIVTDIPNFLHDIGVSRRSPGNRLRIRVYRILSTYFMQRYDGYILLTEAMNPTVNPLRRPHMVMEGLVDPAMEQVDNTLEGKFPERVVLYAGGLYAKYGVATLLEAFRQLPHEHARLWVFGSGELEQTMKEAEAADPRVRFWGIKPNHEVVVAEVQASLLVNPRPTTETFTKFSFPSKNMEYMASGTPLLTADLPGMPPDYHDHVYIFRDESIQGLAAALGDLLDRPEMELHERGRQAKTFVLTRKTNVMQAARMHAFLQAMDRP